MSEVTEKQLEDMEALFVQTAASMTSDGRRITLEGVSPSTTSPTVPSGKSGTCLHGSSLTFGGKGTTALRRTLRTPFCPSRSRATAFPRMPWW